MDVKTAGRLLDLFETFAKAQALLSLSELARALSAPPSSCFNLVRALQAHSRENQTVQLLRRVHHELRG